MKAIFPNYRNAAPHPHKWCDILAAPPTILRHIVIALLLITTFSACRDTTTRTADDALPVQVARPEVRTVTLSREYPGYLKADRTIQLVARVSGSLAGCYYTPGAAVRAGDALFLIEPDTYQQQADEARANLSNARANLVYARANHERTQQAATANAVAQIQVIQAQAAYEQAAAQVRQTEAALQLAEITLGYCRIAAPCAGHVSLSPYDVGNYINATSAPTLATLYKDDTLYAYFNVSENQYVMRHAAVGDARRDSILTHAVVTLPALTAGGSVPCVARLEYVSPNVTLSTGTLQLRALLPNPSGTLRDGMYAVVTLPYAVDEAALLVPDASIGHNQSGPYLYVVGRGDTLHLRPVAIGQLVDDTLRIVTDGLAPTDRYVVRAQLKVRDGMRIAPIEKR